MRADACWIWTGGRQSAGYGRLSFGARTLAHRAVYELLVGPIPEGLTLDHLCRVPLCVNPDHLEPVTRGENVLRGNGLSAQRARQTHCIHGHEFTPENTGLNGRGRRCLMCQNARNAQRSRKQVQS